MQSVKSPLSLVALTTAIALCIWQVSLFIKQINKETTIIATEILFPPQEKPIKKSPSSFAQLLEKKVLIEGVVNLQPEEELSAHQPQQTISFPDIVLLGIVANSTPNKSLAIIQFEGNQKLLSMNEKIGKSKARIIRITENSITLAMMGKNKVLSIPPRITDIYTQQDNAVQRPKEVQVGINNLELNDPLALLRSDILKTPSLFTEYVRFNPVFDENNTITAYRVSPGKNPLVFAVLGLEMNDLVTAISGPDFYVPMTDSDVLDSLWSKMYNIDSFVLHIEREEQQYEIIVPLH